ncbi:MAG: M60 family metallopeptidase, partial [Aeromonas sp.]
ASLPMSQEHDWQIWHELGHNLVAAPLNITGATEVANNVFTLYMQEQRPAPDNRMSRIAIDIKKMPLWLSRHGGHAWSEADAGMRLVMFGQLKIWAEQHFVLSNWYDAANQPSVFSTDQGWNFYQLMHRKARGDTVGDQGTNYCSAQDTGLQDADLLMVCASYVSGYDLSAFFSTWNPGEVKEPRGDGSVNYRGGITAAATSLLRSLALPQPAQNPATIEALPQRAEVVSE